MDAIKYLKEKNRMFDSLGRIGGRCKGVNCKSCPFDSYNSGMRCGCVDFQVEYPEKPSWELMRLVGTSLRRFRSRLFSLNDKVYGSLEMETPFELPEADFIELKASEFYKIIEDLQ